MTQVPQFPILAKRNADAPHPVLHMLETHWKSLRQTGPVPARDDIAPHTIDKALPWTFVLQRVAPGVARMRVAGQALHDILRMDPRGMPLSAFFGPDDRSTLAVHLEMAFSDPTLIALPLFAPATLFRKDVTGQMLLMPLCDAHGDVTRVLGGLVTNGPLGSKSRRLSIDDTKPIRNEPISMMPMQNQPISDTMPMAIRNQAVAHMKKPTAVGRPALSLVVDNS